MFAILLDGYGIVFLCSDLVSIDLFGGSVVIFDYGDRDGCCGDDSDMTSSFGLNGLFSHSDCIDDGGMGVFPFHSSAVMGILPPLFHRI